MHLDFSSNDLCGIKSNLFIEHFLLLFLYDIIGSISKYETLWKWTWYESTCGKFSGGIRVSTAKIEYRLSEW